MPREASGRGGVAGFVARLKQLFIGRPLPTAQLAHERISKTQALAIFASDALSSVAYATEEILLVLVGAGALALSYTLPIAAAIALLLAMVAYSYRQIIFHYPQGGGTYRVTKDNFGPTPALVAGSALMTDYVLTVAVSTSAGVSAVTSAFPSLFFWRVDIALFAIFLITLINLRGVRESATIFALPTYLFIFGVLGLLLVGFWRIGSGLPPAEAIPRVMPAIVEPLGIFLLLRAFASGCSALTGTEAISDGVPAFRQPQAKNAAMTLAWMALILGGMFLGLSFLAQHYGVIPRQGETVISQITRLVAGRGSFYYFIQATTALILFLAANTSFADFPRLAFFMAEDRFLPRQFIFRGDRLAFSTGIIALGLISGSLIYLVRADVHRLIPLYAVGVFLSFTFSQSSMVKRWWTRRETGWQQGLLINGLGALVTGLVALVITVSKFTHGAWMVVLLIPCFVLLFKGISVHYERVAARIKAQPIPPETTPLSTQSIVLVSGVNPITRQVIRYAQGLSPQVTAVHITDDLDSAQELRKAWERLPFQVPLVVLESPYRSLVTPLMEYLDEIQDDQPITVIIAALVPHHWWGYLLHNQDGLRLLVSLFFRPNTAIINFPYHVD